MSSLLRMCARGCAPLPAFGGAAARSGGATPFAAPFAAAPFAAPCGAARGFRKIASRRQRIRRNKISGKFNNKHFQKGRGAPLEGRHTGRGGFVWMPERALDLVVPDRVKALARPRDFAGVPPFALKPYVAAGAPRTPPGASLLDPESPLAPPALAGGLPEYYARLQRRTARAGLEPCGQDSAGAAGGGPTATVVPKGEPGRAHGPKVYAQQKKGRRARQLRARKRRQRLLKEVVIKRTSGQPKAGSMEHR